MSAEFIQFIFPCKDCLVRAACKEKPKNNESIIHLYDVDAARCLTLPKFPSKVAYTKGLLECWANIGVGIINRMQKTEDPQTCSETNNKIPMQYVMLMGQMSYLLQWMINSTSWERGELQDFDRQEIRLKCKSITL
jgi:hypothetical protein